MPNPGVHLYDMLRGNNPIPYFQADDPGPVGRGKTWCDTSGGTGNFVLKIRNNANTGWEPLGSMGMVLQSVAGNVAIASLDIGESVDITVVHSDVLTFTAGGIPEFAEEEGVAVLLLLDGTDGGQFGIRVTNISRTTLEYNYTYGYVAIDLNWTRWGIIV